MAQKVDFPLNKAHRILSPRLAYLVTTTDRQGNVNAAPFSNVTSVSTDPERIVLATMRGWDTYRNIRLTGEFVVNVPGEHLLGQIWICGDKYAGVPIPYGINELKIAGLHEMPATRVRPPRVTECFGHLECKKVWIREVGDHSLILADVVAASCNPEAFDDDWIQKLELTKPLMQNSGNRFTYAEERIEVDVKEMADRIRRSLKTEAT